MKEINAILKGSPEDQVFNVNEFVHIKLREEGIDILRTEHYELYKRVKENAPHIKIPTFRLTLDKEGYHQMQLWDFMKTFGPKMRLGDVLPFDAEIVINKIN